MRFFQSKKSVFC